MPAPREVTSPITASREATMRMEVITRAMTSSLPLTLIRCEPVLKHYSCRMVSANMSRKSVQFFYSHFFSTRVVRMT